MPPASTPLAAMVTPPVGVPSRSLVGLIGAGIQRSLTPAMHEAEAAAHGLRLHYQLIDLDRAGVGPDALPTLIAAAKWMDFAGLNITYPCKQAVLAQLDELSDEARSMGAVNTVVFRDGRAIGHNTDGSGWRWGFERALPGADLSRVVLLGAGGAGSAIAHALLRMDTASLRIVDMDPVRARALAAGLNLVYPGARAAADPDAARALRGASGLVHATPTGMSKLPGLPLSGALLHPGLWVAEIVYFPFETELLRTARALGCATVDGGTMAIGQAIGAFRLFTGLDADAVRVAAHFERLIGAAT
ncbi:MAG: shikimate dehydrogenase [Burkholderiaceae bacterium]|nr:shikimate dehydrogenase [Burkholderiaceae bacterium]MBP8309122.1 shikimate dehydrogenase [Burkholderiaceae bacterium]